MELALHLVRGASACNSPSVRVCRLPLFGNGGDFLDDVASARRPNRNQCGLLDTVCIRRHRIRMANASRYAAFQIPSYSPGFIPTYLTVE